MFVVVRGGALNVVIYPVNNDILSLFCSQDVLHGGDAGAGSVVWQGSGHARFDDGSRACLVEKILAFLGLLR